MFKHERRRVFRGNARQRQIVLLECGGQREACPLRSTQTTAVLQVGEQEPDIGRQA